MSDNESLELACKHVVEQIDDELKDECVPEGTRIRAGELRDCDCVPLVVTDSRGRTWRLIGVESVYNRRGWDLLATYKC